MRVYRVYVNDVELDKFLVTEKDLADIDIKSIDLSSCRSLGDKYIGYDVLTWTTDYELFLIGLY